MHSGGWTKSIYLDRILTLLPSLDVDVTYSFSELASRLGCSQSQLKKMLDILLGVDIFEGNDALLPYTNFLPLVVDVDTQTLTISQPLPALSRPFRLDELQVLAAILALRMTGVRAADPRIQALQDSVGADGDGINTDKYIEILAQPYDIEIFDILSQAELDECCVEIDYRNVEGRRTTRIIEPSSVYSENKTWFTNAWCQASGELRTFRLDRIEDARLVQTLATHLARRIETRPQSIVFTESMEVARIHFASPSDFDASIWRGSKVYPCTKGGLDVDVPLVSESWIARNVVATLGRATVKYPESARAAVAEETRVLLDAYGHKSHG